MKVLGKRVVHRIFGAGDIIAQTEGRITVQFKESVKNFVYPDAFEKFLVFTDSEYMRAITEELENIKAEKMRRAEKVRQETIKPEPYKQADIKRSRNPNIVFKCNYCNGGANKNNIGFCGICSDKNIKYNINLKII